MTKQQFLDGLYSALNGKIDESLIKENIDYYRDYIDSQVRMGRTEEEVVRQLGDPRLIAKSIAEANKHAGVEGNGKTEYQNADTGYAKGGYYGGSYAQGQYEHNVGHGNRQKIHRIPGWLIALIIGIVIFLIVKLIFSVFSFLMPLILPVLLIALIVRFFRST